MAVDSTLGKFVSIVFLSLFVILLLFALFNPQGLYSKVIVPLYSLWDYLPGMPSKKLIPSSEIPAETKTMQQSFLDALEKTPSKEKCLQTFPDLSALKGNKLALTTFQGINTYIEKPSGKEGGVKLNQAVTKNSNLKTCVADPKATYACYLEKNVAKRTCTAPLYRDVDSMTLGEKKITLDGKEYDLDRTYIFRPDPTRICFLPTHQYYGESILPWNSFGCDVSTQTLDDDCIEILAKAIPSC